MASVVQMTRVANDPEPFEEGAQVALNGGGEIMTVSTCRKDKDVKGREVWWVDVDYQNRAGDPVFATFKAKQLMLWADSPYEE